MHAVAQQQRTGMVSGSMAKGGIGITASPGQDGSAINDEITSSDESRLDCMQDSQHKERLIQGCTGCVATFALLGFARNAELSLLVQGQPTRQGQRIPTLQPVMHLLI